MLKTQHISQLKTDCQHWSKVSILSLFIIIQSLIVYGKNNLQTDSLKFDKQKWLTSSHYRYKIVRSDIFPDLEKLNRKQIVKLLGQPNFNNKNIISYCLDIPNEKLTSCKGSFLAIDLNKKVYPKYKVIIGLVD